MSYDITDLLQGWDYQPGQVAARKFRGEDGVDKIQLRVDLGILQMNATGRPDGKRPLGQGSWYEVMKQRQERAAAGGGEFRLGAEDCMRLQQESIQYHHRYICEFQLEDFAAVIRDCDRNIEVFGFVGAHAQTEELAWSLQQFTPQLLLMRTRAAGMLALREPRGHDQALDAVEEGIFDLEAFFREHGREEALEGSNELVSLRRWLDEIRAKRPLSEVEKLRRALDEAIQIEDYEKAAEVRDQLRKLEASGS